MTPPPLVTMSFYMTFFYFDGVPKPSQSGCKPCEVNMYSCLPRAQLLQSSCSQGCSCSPGPAASGLPRSGAGEALQDAVRAVLRTQRCQSSRSSGFKCTPGLGAASQIIPVAVGVLQDLARQLFPKTQRCQVETRLQAVLSLLQLLSALSGPKTLLEQVILYYMYRTSYPYAEPSQIYFS